MSDATTIEWTDATWNPVRGCALVSHGCTNCYAMKQAHRFSGPGKPYAGLTKMTSHGPVWTGEVRTVPELLEWPLQQKKPLRIFVNSMSDLFHEDVPDAFIDAVVSVIIRCHVRGMGHAFQLLTKRAARAREFMRGAFQTNNPPPNLWLGVSVENQETADERIPLLLETPAAVRWISAEPLLGPVNIGMYLTRSNLFGQFMPGFTDCLPGLQWVVAGGESGPGARPAHPDWFRLLRMHCNAAHVPFLFKQWGAYGPCELHPPGVSRIHVVTIDGRVLADPMAERDDLQAEMMCRFGKKAAGRVLDGRTWDEFPA